MSTMSNQGLRRRGEAKPDKRYADTADAGQAKQAQQNDSKVHSDVNDGGGFIEAVVEVLTTLTVGLKSRLSRWLKGRGATQAQVVDPTGSTQAALDILEAKRASSFDPTREEHEDMLKELWALLQPDVPFERNSKNWSDIGFQGKDPVTDFRGQGLLGLHNLLHFCQEHTDQARDMLLRPHGGFPLALAAINISAFLTGMVNKHAGLIGNALFEQTTSSFEILGVFNELFCLVFLHFEEAYSAAITKYLSTGGNPAFTIMQFNPIREKFMADLELQVAEGKFDEVFVDTAKTRSQELVPKTKADMEEVDTSAVAAGAAKLALPSHATDASDKAGTKENNLIDLS